MKPRTGCESCRSRHRKCYVPPGNSKCHACTEVGGECNFALRFVHSDAGDRQRAKASKAHGGAPPDAGVADVAVQEQQTPETSGPASWPLLDPGAQAPSLTKREALLFKTYILRLAPNSDAVDESRHFTHTVPRLALQHPILLNGILALASRYTRLGGEPAPELEATYYHSRCIELLIAALDRPPETFDAILLTAVVFARLYEEFEIETDSECYHLAGAQRLLCHDVIARFALKGGLAEAASLIHLRQAIYVSLTRRRCLNVSLHSFERFATYKRGDDSGHANRVILLFAKALQLLFPPGTLDDNQSAFGYNKVQDQYTWDSLGRDIYAWRQSIPASFQPLYYQDADRDRDRPFPQIDMLPGPSVDALQYYHASQTLLLLQSMRMVDVENGINTPGHRARYTSMVAENLCTLMGLCNSNPHQVHSFYLPSHMLSLCGYCIEHPVERAHTVEFLRQAHKTLRWNTNPVVESLQREWQSCGK